MKRSVLLGAAVALALSAFSRPAAGATQLSCKSPCVVQTHAFGYVPPVVEIASGTQVAWQTSDTSHPTADAFGAARCFQVAVGLGTPVVPVRFDVADGSLRATTAPGTPGASTSACANAVALPTGAFALPFHCLLHPWMVGALLVEP